MRSAWSASLLASVGVLGVSLVLAGEVLRASVEFAPQLAAKFERQYGSEQQAVVTSAITAALARASGLVQCSGPLAVRVVVEDVSPTHPTPKELTDNPSLDVMRTRYLGGAQLTGYIQDASGQTAGTIKHRYFAPTLIEGSISGDPWADAQLAIDEFAAKLVAACHDRAGDADHRARIVPHPDN